MGYHNLSTVFADMMVVIWADWQEESYKIGIPSTGLEVTMDDIMLFVLLLVSLLNYLEVF